MLQKGRELAGGARLEAELGPERIQHLKRLLTEGKSVKECVSIIQNDWKEMLSYKNTTLRTMIYRYNRFTVAAEVTSRIRETVIDKGPIAVSTLEDLKELASVQRRRVLKSLAVEEKAPLPLKQTSEEIRLMADILRNLAALQIEVGILPRAAKTVKGVVMGEDGRPTVFGWVENDEQLLTRLSQEIEVEIVEPDDPQ